MFTGLFKNLSKKKRDKPFQGKNRVSLPVECPYRILGNVLILSVIAGVALVLITLRDDLVNKKFDKLMDGFYAFSLEYSPHTQLHPHRTKLQFIGICLIQKNNLCTTLSCTFHIFHF